MSDHPTKTVTPTITRGEAGPPGGCVLYGLESAVYPNEFVNGFGPTIECSTGDGSVFASLQQLFDPRVLTDGVHRLSANEAGLAVEVAQGCGGTGTPCLLCQPSVSDVEVTVSVEEAFGGSAPYPELATPDFKRTFRVELAIDPRPALARTGSPQCTGNMSLSISLHLQQTAADWIYDPNGPCSCE